MSDSKRIMCFGDSLTWGWVPVLEGIPTTRYPFHERWPGVMASKLGDGYQVLEEGLSARTTDIDDPLDPRLNGSNHLPAALATHLPLDLVILMLGTNDTKSYFKRTPYEIASGMSKLAVQVLNSAGGVGTQYPAPQVLIVAPPPLSDIPHPWLQGMFEGGVEKSQALSSQYAALGTFLGVRFFDAGTVVSVAGCDGIHFTTDNNAALGGALANVVRDMLSGNE